MTIETISDLVEAINLIHQDDKNEAKFIQTEGLAKFKSTIYEILQYLDNDLPFDNLSQGKKNLYQALFSFSPEQRLSLSQAMLTSYYTPDYIVNSITEHINSYIESSNLTQVSILEPSAGTGKFIPNLIGENRSIDAVEIDYFTAKILQNNFNSPAVAIHNTGFENFQNKQLYDVVVGNVPFGKFQVYDPKLTTDDLKNINGKIHNYFFHKSVQNLKPGGVLFLVTASSTTNSSDDKAFREFLMQQTNLISCIRFDQNTFNKSGTKEVTDLIVLQKPLEPKKEIRSERELKYINVVPFALDDRFTVNQYFNDNPQYVLGEHSIGSGFLGRDALIVANNATDIENGEKLNAFLAQNIASYSLKKVLDIPLEPQVVASTKVLETEVSEQIHNQIKNAYPLANPGNIIVLENAFYKVVPNPDHRSFLDKVPFEVAPKNQTNLFSLIELRDTYKTLIEATREKDFDKAILLQNKLDDLYNTYTFFNDTINSKYNSFLLAMEVEGDLLKSLEVFDKSQNAFVKSDVFTKDFSIVQEKSIAATSIDDAIALSFHTYGSLNISYISDIYLKDTDTWIKEALDKELLFVDPIIANNNAIDNFELAIPSRFNSGYIEGKLAIYSNTNLLFTNNKYASLLDKKNLDAAKNTLAKNLPLKLTLSEINPGLGEPWIDVKIYQMFAQEHFQDERFTVQSIPAFDSFKITAGFSKFASSNYSVESSTKNVHYSKVFSYGMEHCIPEFTKKIFKGTEVIKVADKETINAVNLSIQKMNAEFTLWLASKPEITLLLENKYHLNNNAIVKENFNISLLNFDSLVGLTPYEHQKNAVWQNVTQMGGILDHEVGFGKTLTMAMTTMTKRKFNLINKELVVGLNANYKAIYDTYKTAYPNGKFLLVTPEDIAPGTKQQTFYKIANNDYDAIITAHSCLMKFPIAPHSQKEILGEIISDIKKTLTLSEESKNGLFSQRQINDLNKRLLNAEAEYKYAVDVINNKKEKGFIIFDDLGINSLTIDESHEFKNLEFSTKHSRVAGLGNQDEVQKTRNLLSYVRFVQKQHGGDKGVTFASGTTISNSITELFLLFKYLCPTKLKAMNMETFDQWARVYARKTSEYEETVSGLIKQKERFRYFVKVPELSKIYSDMTNYADFNTFKIERPQAEIHLIPIEPYKEQLDYFNRIKEFGRTKDISFLHNKGEETSRAKAKAVGLICTNEGKKASLSLKMIDPSWPDSPNDKINTMTGIVYEQYLKYNSHKGTQLIFCDQGVPGGANYNIYAYTKDLLIKKGIPAEEIAFIHSYDKKKQVLFDKVNNGEIRVLLGSTTKMGVGVNVQEKIVAMHHIDFPWRPTDMVQRNGRGERPGNLLLPLFDNTIPVFFYATIQSLDSYTFNLLQIKQNFIQQIKNASISTRTIDEGLIDAKGNMNFSDYMAACSTNQNLTKRLEVEKKLNFVLDIQNAADLNSRKSLTRLSFLQSDIAKAEKNIALFSADLDLAKSIRPLTYNNTTFNSTKEIADFLRANLDKVLNAKNGTNTVATLDNDFKLVAFPKVKDFPMDKDNYKLFLQTPNHFKIGFKSHLFTKDDKEVAFYCANCIERIPSIIVSEKNNLDDALKEKSIVDKTLANKIDKSEEIKSLRNELKNLDALIEKESKKNNSNDLNNDNEKNNSKGGPKL